MYDLIVELAKRNPSYPFFGKWGGGQYDLPGKGFAFYAEDKEDALFMVAQLSTIASEMGVRIEPVHQLGIFEYQQFITFDGSLMSQVREPERFKMRLKSLKNYPHYFHELFQEK
jgi:hypothetical protein